MRARYEAWLLRRDALLAETECLEDLLIRPARARFVAMNEEELECHAKEAQGLLWLVFPNGSVNAPLRRWHGWACPPSLPEAYTHPYPDVRIHTEKGEIIGFVMGDAFTRPRLCEGTLVFYSDFVELDRAEFFKQCHGITPTRVESLDDMIAQLDRVPRCSLAGLVLDGHAGAGGVRTTPQGGTSQELDHQAMERHPRQPMKLIASKMMRLSPLFVYGCAGAMHSDSWRLQDLADQTGCVVVANAANIRFELLGWQYFGKGQWIAFVPRQCGSAK